MVYAHVKLYLNWKSFYAVFYGILKNGFVSLCDSVLLYYLKC